MEKKNSHTPYIITIVILVAVILGGGAYFLFFHNKGNDNSSNESKADTDIKPPAVADITDDDQTTTVTKNTLLGNLDCIKDQLPEADYCKIPTTKIRNAREGETYTLTELTKEESGTADFEKLAKITIDKNDAKQVKIEFDKNMVEKFYDTKNYGYTVSISFDRDVVSTKIAGFGQGVGDEYIFFLMKDSTVDILRVSTMLSDRNFNPHRIQGVDHVVAVLGGSTYNDITGGHTNYAVRDDQTAYDLMTLVPSWGLGN